MLNERPRTQALLYSMAMVAGIWAALAPLLIFFPLFEVAVTAEETSRVSAVDANRMGDALAVLLPTAALGIFGIASTQALVRGKAFGQLIMAGIAMVLLGLTIFTASSVGPFLIVPAILFIFPALWLESTSDRAQESLGRATGQD